MARHKRLIGLLCLTLILAGCLWGVSSAQQVTPQQQTLPVQFQQPGNPNTLQTYVSGTNTASAGSCSITIAANAGKTLYITSIEVTGSGATAGSSINVTLASGGTTIANWVITVPAGVTTASSQLFIYPPQPIVGLAPGQNMVLTVPSFGAGNTNTASAMRGYYQ